MRREEDFVMPEKVFDHWVGFALYFVSTFQPSTCQ